MSNIVDLFQVLGTFNDLWAPRTIATINDYDVRVFKAGGEFTWHAHPETDEFFLVLKGSLTIRMRDRDVLLARGQLYVVSRGVQHQPVATEGTEVLLLEPSATINTGNSPGELTAPRRTV